MVNKWQQGGENEGRGVETGRGGALGLHKCEGRQ